MRYSFASYTRPGELHEIDPATGENALLKRATVLGNFNPRDYMERRVWITARDGERIPVSLVWHAIARRRIRRCSLPDMVHTRFPPIRGSRSLV